MTTRSMRHQFVAEFTADFSEMSSEEIRSEAVRLQESMHLQVDGVVRALTTGDAELMTKVSKMLVANTAFVATALTELAQR